MDYKTDTQYSESKHPKWLGGVGKGKEKAISREISHAKWKVRERRVRDLGGKEPGFLHYKVVETPYGK